MLFRYGQPQDYEKAKDIWRKCFLDSDEEVDFYFENLYDKNNYLVIEEKGEIRASIHENKYTLSINGNEMPSIFLVALAVLPQFRGKGYMKKLLNYSLTNARKKGYPFIYLSAINPHLYRSFGFEYVTEIEEYRFDINEIPDRKIPQDIEVASLNKDNYEEYLNIMLNIYKNEMRTYSFYVKRSEKKFANLLKEVFSDSGEAFIFYKNGIAKGYIILYRDEIIRVREMFGEDKEIIDTMLTFIKSFKEYYSHVHINSPIGKRLGFYFKNQKRVEDIVRPFAMGRILNVLEFFKVTELKIKNLKILVEDDVIAANRGVYHFDEYGNITQELNEKEWDLKIDIASLTALLLGYIDIERLIFMKRAVVKNGIKKEICLLEFLSLQKGFVQDYQ